MKGVDVVVVAEVVKAVAAKEEKAVAYSVGSEAQARGVLGGVMVILAVGAMPMVAVAAAGPVPVPVLVLPYAQGQRLPPIS